MRQNPATVFMAHVLAESNEGLPWSQIDDASRDYWYQMASYLVIKMYENGFTIPPPENADRVWDELKQNV